MPTTTPPSEAAYWREDQRIRDLTDALPSTEACANCPVRRRAFYDMAAAVTRQSAHIPAVHGLWGRRRAVRNARREIAVYKAMALLEDGQWAGARDTLLAERPRDAAGVEAAVERMGAEGITRAGLAGLVDALDWEVGDGLVNPCSIGGAYI